MNRPVKRSFAIRGHRTSLSLEEPFWHALKEIAIAEHLPIAGLVTRIDTQRGSAGLSSAVRVYILDYYRSRAIGPAGIGGRPETVETSTPRPPV